MNPIPNLGPVSRGWLEEIGVYTIDDLRELGSVPIYVAIKQRHPKASLNLLWALEAAIIGCDWRNLPEPRKKELRREIE